MTNVANDHLKGFHVKIILIMRKGIKNRGRMISASDILGISDGTKFAAGGGAPPPPPPPTGLRQN